MMTELQEVMMFRLMVIQLQVKPQSFLLLSAVLLEQGRNAFKKCKDGIQVYDVHLKAIYVKKQFPFCDTQKGLGKAVVGTDLICQKKTLLGYQRWHH